MRRIACCLLVAISCLSAPRADAAVRPRYGGTLRIETQALLTSLDPKEFSTNEAETIGRQRILPLVFETLVGIDAEGRAHPRLAVAWQSDLSFRRWQFYLRPGVRYQDGTLLASAVVMQSLAGAHPDWTMHSEGDSLVIESETPRPDLLAELALVRNSIVWRNTGGEWLGTGPFRIANWQAGKILELAANETCWSGRPFVDAVQIQLARSSRDQMLALQLGRADLIELGADQISKAGGDARGMRVPLPEELLALVTLSGKTEDAPVREALSAAIDRKAMHSVLLRSGSEATASALPSWMSGEAFLFPVQVDTTRARQLLSGVKRTSALTLSYESGDGLARLMAERIALNAREVGLQVQAVPSATSADLRLTRMLLPSPDPRTALREIARALGVSLELGGGSPQDVYAAEEKLLEGSSLIPLFHIPVASLAGEHVRNWTTDKLGGWPLAGVSLNEVGEPSRP